MKLITALFLLLTLVNGQEKYSTIKTSCIQQSEHSGKTLDQLKEILIGQAKQEALGELYGQLMYSKTDLTNGKIVSDEIRQRAVGSVRVDGNPKFYNGSDFGSICADVTSYITKKDLEKYSPKEVKLNRYCFNDSSVPMNKIKSEAKYGAYKEIISQYKPSLKLSNKQAENLIHGFKISNDKFDFDTASYCFDAIGTILPYELEMNKNTTTYKNINMAKSIKKIQPINNKIYKSCKDIKDSLLNSVDGSYTIKPKNKKIKVYCDMQTDGGGWTQFGYIDHPSDNFRRSVNIGTFNQGKCDNNSICSLDANQLYKSSNQQFDLMIHYGDKKVQKEVFNGYYKYRNNYFIPATFNTHNTGQHGMFGDDKVDGYYASYCAIDGGCKLENKDYWNFSLFGCYPDKASNVICGFYGWNGVNWKNCRKSDNKHIMKYFIREH